MSTMIALVGDQPLPNFLPVRHYHPDSILLVYTASKRQKYEYLKATLQKEVRIMDLEADAYNIPAITRLLHEELDRLVDQVTSPLVFNLTGATKPMSLAAYQVAQQRGASAIYLESEGKNTRVYHYAWADQQLQAKGDELLPECVTLQDVFDLYLGPGKWEECGASRDEGGPFEELLASVLREQGYEVMLGVKALDKQVDIDIAVRSDNHYGIIEAKMGAKGRTLDGVKQLSTAVRLLGTYSRTFYAITVEPNSQHKMLTDAANIEVVSLLSYDKTANTLSPTDTAELLAKVKKALKG